METRNKSISADSERRAAGAGAGDRAPLLRMRGIGKSFPGVQALTDINLELMAGEVLALLGENGAGKSTLIRILGGAELPDAGTIEIDGLETLISNPVDAQRAGVGIIYQEFNLVPAMSARENIFLGQEPGTVSLLRAGDERARAIRLFERLGVAVNPESPCRGLTVAQQQVVEIAKALSLNARILVMDEPSATLTLQEVDRLFGVIRELKSRGIGVIYISHRLEEIFEVADRVMVLRDGTHVGTRPIREINRAQLIEMMVGRDLEHEFPQRESQVGAERIAVRGLTRGPKVRGVSFHVRAGEVVGLTGLVGAGRTEVARILFGVDSPESGSMSLDGAPYRPRNPRDAIRAGVCLLSEDRKGQGLVLRLSVLDNFGLPNLSRFSSMGWIRQGAIRKSWAEYARALRIKVPHERQPVMHLSGGNQQKVVLAKWLERNAEIIVFDEPTRGIDVGAKYEIYVLINRLAARGKAVLMISSELPEILGMSDRILVMHEGRLTGEIADARGATQEEVMHLAVG